MTRRAKTPRSAETGTFSIVARCKRTGDFGVASATAAHCVGAFLPYALEGVGAVATQAWVNVNLGYQGMELMRAGLPAKASLEALLSEDTGRARRQVVAIDSGSVFGYTGEECTEAKGHLLGEDFGVAGNILADVSVLQSMSDAYRKSKGDIGHRLIAALEAGQAAGGDSRGKLSSVLLVASTKPKLYHDLRVDMSDQPVPSLRRLYEECKRTQEEYGDSDDDGEVIRKRVPRVQK
jgi:uncharacterized Ntn-hydrolase superfamily protein